VVAKWTGDLDTGRMTRILNNETPEEAQEPEAVLDQVEHHMPVSAAR
jgi:aerobic C4-dicarboxylate transport protein